MANILPSDSLKKIRYFYLSRAVMAGCLVAIACGVATLLALVSAYSIVSSISLGTGAPPENSLPARPGDDRKDLVYSQSLLKELEPVASTSSVTTLIEAALLARPHGIFVQNIRLMRTDISTLLLSGSAASRDDINAYQEALSKNPRFKSVSVPIGILAGTKDNRFTVTLTGDF